MPSQTLIISMNIKLSKAHLSEIIQLGGFLSKTLSNVMINLGKKTYTFVLPC